VCFPFFVFDHHRRSFGRYALTIISLYTAKLNTRQIRYVPFPGCEVLPAEFGEMIMAAGARHDLHEMH